MEEGSKILILGKEQLKNNIATVPQEKDSMIRETNLRKNKIFEVEEGTILY